MTSHTESRLKVEGRPYYGRCVNRVTPVTRARGARSWAAPFGSRCNSTWASGTFRYDVATYTASPPRYIGWASPYAWPGWDDPWYGPRVGFGFRFGWPYYGRAFVAQGRLNLGSSPR